MLDAFFSRIKKDVKTLFPGKRIEVAYGEAGLTMSPTGKGEVSVPTGGTYQACTRIMTDAHDASVRCKVTPVSEHNTTKRSWETGADKMAVHRVIKQRDGNPNVSNRPGLGAHERGKLPPLAPEKDRRLLEIFRNIQRDKDKRRRGGTTPAALRPETDRNKTTLQFRFPEIRGLCFCPRRHMFVARDADAASTIARLRTQELLGRPRPAPFVRD